VKISREARLVAIVLATAVSCGGGGPVTPSPNPDPTPDPDPVVNNTPPTIGAFKVQGSRANEPANFADVSEEVEVSVSVTDPESQTSDLKFNWSVAVGTFNGSGAKVMWKAPTEAETPMEVALNLEVVETYTSQGRNVETKVTGSTKLMLHDSIKEVSELSRQFLLDFSDSSLSVDHVMRNFQPDCYGTADEMEQVGNNRADFTIIDHTVDPAKTTINFGGICPFRAKAGDACARVPVYWKSVAKRDVYDRSGRRVFRTGDQTIAKGVDQLAANYYRDQKRWRLCDSQFDPDSTSLKALRVNGLVP
jgi:hypothetical protein